MEPIFSAGNNPQNGYTVFFDLDHTCISRVSGKEVAINAIRKGYVRISELIEMAALYFLYRIKLIEPQKMAEKLIGWTSGIPEFKMDEICSETVENVLLPSVYRDAISEIEFHRMNKAKIVILSASIAQVCNKIAAIIDADGFIATILETKDGILTGRATGSICFGEGKKVQLRDYCIQNSINISESWYYGDSVSDVPVFDLVGSPVCINPDNKLKKKALERGWKILNWSS
jgi:HAD superfamily hydrolase (TIGR01490 family)